MVEVFVPNDYCSTSFWGSNPQLSAPVPGENSYIASTTTNYQVS